MIRASDIASAASAGAHARCHLDHGAGHLGVMSHAEIVVGTPDYHLARAARGMPEGMRKTAGDAFEVGKYPVTALIPQRGQGRLEKTFVIHYLFVRRLFPTFPR